MQLTTKMEKYSYGHRIAESCALLPLKRVPEQRHKIDYIVILCTQLKTHFSV